MEQVLDWLNENALRAFPLMDDFVIPFGNDLLLDLQLVVSQNISATPIMLRSLLYDNSGALVVEFGTSTTTLSSFTIADPLTTVYPKYVRLPAGSLAVFGEGVKRYISGATQGMPELFTILVEPSRVTQFNDAWLGVTSLSTGPEKASDPNFPGPELPLVPVSTPTTLTGSIQLLAGYNFRVNISGGAIDLEIGSNFGLKATCHTSFIPSQYLDCDKLVSYINGVPPDSAGNFKLNQGSNIVITPGTTLDSFNDPFTEEANSHTLFVGLSFQTTDLCAPVNIKPSSV